MPENQNFRYFVSPSTWLMYDFLDYEQQIPLDAVSFDKMTPTYEKWVLSLGRRVENLPI